AAALAEPYRVLGVDGGLLHRRVDAQVAADGADVGDLLHRGVLGAPAVQEVLQRRDVGVLRVAGPGRRGRRSVRLGTARCAAAGPGGVDLAERDRPGGALVPPGRAGAVRGRAAAGLAHAAVQGERLALGEVARAEHVAAKPCGGLVSGLAAGLRGGPGLALPLLVLLFLFLFRL